MSGRGRGDGGAAAGGSRHLLSGKAKKEQLLAKREKERVKAEKLAAWEKRQQAATEQQIRDRHNPQQPPDEHDDDEEDDEADGTEKHSRAEIHHTAADEDDDGVLAVRRLDITKPTATHTQSHPPQPRTSTDAHTTAAASATSAVPQFAPLETSGQPLRNKLRTLFAKESTEEVEQRKLQSRQPLRRHSPLDGHCPSIDPWRTVIPLPARPPWTANTTAQQLHEAEEAAFTAWLESIYGKWPAERLNHFEHNLEVWRQLWRVVEQSDVLLCIVDIRFPLINFPPALYDYVVNKSHKPLLVLLNKVDLVPRRVVDDWHRYFHRLYPQLPVVAYTSKPRETGSTNEEFDVLVRNRWKVAGGSLVLGEAYGVDELMAMCRAVVKERVAGLSDEVKEKFSFEPTYIIDAEGQGDDGEEKETKGDDAKDEQAEAESDGHGKGKSKGKSRRRHKAGKSKQSRDDNNDDGGEEEENDEGAEEEEEHEEKAVEPPTRYSRLFGKLEDQSTASSSSTTRPPAPYITIGTIGAPNAGKSSLINSLAHRKLVSVSKTPGHTKYLQTLFLNRYTRLCDAPGLVFPAVDMPRALQVLAGCFPIAQTRDPYSAVKLLAECVPLERVYKLRPVPVDDRGEWTYEDDGKWEWTAWSVCEAMAWQKGYRNKHGVLDLYRAANAILRDELDGTVVMYTTPPHDEDGHTGTDTAAAMTVASGGRAGKGRGQEKRDADSDDEGNEAVSTHGKRGKRGKGKRRQQSTSDDDNDTDER